MDDEAREEQPMTDLVRRGIVDRMIGAAFLDVNTYEEVEADAQATGQAAAVVALTAVAAAIGQLSLGPVAMVSQAVASLVRWIVWAGITYVVGDKVFGGTATWGELLRTLGFAQAPGVLAVAGFVPIVGGLVYLAIVPWMLVTGVIAIRQALDFGTGKALLTALIGLIPYMIALAILF